ncbi:YjbQ family protein [Candidatus Sumerlaeota bacterium]|nr:YjbQ family protein [Candidatus Sumerlaeota bacterium]
MLQVIRVATEKRVQLQNITAQVRDIVRRSGVNSGLCYVYCPHTTAAITVNENADPDVCSDITRFIGKLVPADFGFDHAEGNSDAHVLSSLFGVGKTFIIEQGDLLLGQWQGIYFSEFDGPRNRTVYVSIIKEEDVQS